MYQAPTIKFTILYPGSAGESSLFDLSMQSGSVLNPLFPADGTLYDGYCLDKLTRINVPGTYDAAIYSSYETGVISANVSPLANSTFLGNLDNINWLLNQYDGANAGITSGEVQAAIWQLMGQDWTSEASYLGPVDQADVDALAAEALTHDGFVPDVGQRIGLVVAPVDGAGNAMQPLIIETAAAKLGDQVWHDLDADGLQDADEQGIGGATVQLVRDMDADGQYTSANEVIATTTTDDTGHYEFRGLAPGVDYQVRFTLPSGFDATSPRQADGSAASGANSDGLLSDVLVLAPGEYNSGIDAGFYRYAALGDTVWLDADRNGQQDLGEAGVANVTVKLLDAAGNVVATQATSDAGAYQFLGLVPGSYSVQFIQPAGYTFTSADTGLDATDSDADPATGLTAAVLLQSGDNVLSIDAGLVTAQAPAKAHIGNLVFEDANANGVQDAGEVGVIGATILLKDAAGNVLASTTSDDAGRYGFDVDAGTYSLQVVVPPESASYRRLAQASRRRRHARQRHRCRWQHRPGHRGRGRNQRHHRHGSLPPRQPGRPCLAGCRPQRPARHRRSRHGRRHRAPARCRWQRGGHARHRRLGQLPVHRPDAWQLQRGVRQARGL